jgi:hypothetical protein
MGNPWIRLVDDLSLRWPMLVLDVVGVALALAWWRRHPLVSLFALLAFGLEALASVVGLVVLSWCAEWLFRPPLEEAYSDDFLRSVEQKMALFRGISLLRNSIMAVAQILLLCALFTGRPHKAGARQLSR